MEKKFVGTDVKVQEKILVEPRISGKGENNALLLGILIDQADIPFHIEVQYAAEFELSGEAEEKIADRLARVNIAAMLYPYIRQEVSDKMWKAGLTPIILQPLNFVAMYEEKEKSKKVPGDSKRTSGKSK